MARWMPKLEAYFHYRNLDVSTLKEPKPADGDYVTLTGQIVAKEYIERGSVLILKAATATKIASATGAK